MLSIAYSRFCPDFEEKCMDCSCPIADWGLRQPAGGRPSLGGLTTKATMSLGMNKIAFDTARYRALGRFQRGRLNGGIPWAADAIRASSYSGDSFGSR